MVGGHDHDPDDQQRPGDPEGLGEPMAADAEPGGPDHHREGAVHARHRGVGVDEDLDDRRVVVDVREVGDRVDEAVLRVEPRRRGREQRVADQRQPHRGHEHVADEVEGLVAEQVEPDEEGDRDRELAVHVDLVREVDQPARRQEEGLQVGLEEGVRRALEVDDLLAVGERDVVLAVGDSADGLVADVCEDEEPELANRGRSSPGATAPRSLAKGERTRHHCKVRALRGALAQKSGSTRARNSRTRSIDVGLGRSRASGRRRRPLVLRRSEARRRRRRPKRIGR